MKQCPKCHRVWNDANRFCQKCGVALQHVVGNTPSEPSAVAHRKRAMLWSALLICITIIIGILAYPKWRFPGKFNADGVPVTRGPNGQESISRPGSVAAANKAFVEDFGSPRFESEPAAPPDTARQSDTAPRRRDSDPSGARAGTLPNDSVVAPGIGALTRPIADTELERFANEKLCRLRNEFFVRRGYTFSDKTHRHLTSFFEEQPWYHTRSNQSYDNDRPVPWDSFSANEKATIDAIKRIEQRRGSWHISHRGPQPFEELSAGEGQ